MEHKQNNGMYTLSTQEKVHNLRLTKQNIETKIVNLQKQLEGINAKLQKEIQKAQQQGN